MTKNTTLKSTNKKKIALIISMVLGALIALVVLLYLIYPSDIRHIASRVYHSFFPNTPTPTPTITPTPTFTPSPTPTPTLPPILQEFQAAVSNPVEVIEWLCANGWIYDGDLEFQKYGENITRSPLLSLEDGFGDCSEFALLAAFGLEDDNYNFIILSIATRYQSDGWYIGHGIYTWVDDSGRYGYVDMWPCDYPDQVRYFFEPQFNSIEELALYYQNNSWLSDTYHFVRFSVTTLEDLNSKLSGWEWRTSDWTDLPGLPYSDNFALP